MSRTHLVVLSVLAVLAASFLGAGAPAVAATARTTITIKVAGCNGCRIDAYNFRTQRSYSGKKVAHGKVTLVVPSAATKGLGFFVGNSARNPQYVADFLAVARYAGKKAGQTVSSSYAAKATRGTQCYAGTTKKSVTFKLNVVHYPGKGNMGEKVDEIRSYFTPTLRSYGTPWRAYRGQLGTQSVIDCSGRYPG